MLIAKNLKKRYRRRDVVNGVSLQIRAGEIVGLLGPNGAGKTTCFYMLVGLIAPDTGQVIVGDKEVTHLPMHSRAHLGIGYLPQEPSVFRKLSVADNILAILELRRELSRSERLVELESLLDEFNIQAIRSHIGYSLSGGERRRVEIARAIAANPRFILLDEPFAGVDPISVSDIKAIISHLAARQIGILITDHNVRETLDVCQRAYIMSAGELITQGAPELILTNEHVRSVYLGTSFQL